MLQNSTQDGKKQNNNKTHNTMKDNYTICHLFAQGEKDNANGNHIFFETERDGSRILYSYGYHFAIAKIDTEGRCFFTSRRYSVTTTRHISIAEGATSHYKKIYCPYPECGTRLNFDSWLKDLKQLDVNLARARKKEKPANKMLNICSQVQAWCEATNTDIPAFVEEYRTRANTQTASPEAMQRAAQERAYERQEKENRRRYEEERQARIKARQMSQEERIYKWEQGENIYLDWQDTAENVPLRIEQRKNYNIIKTAKGVQVNLIKAEEFYKRLKAGEIKEDQKIDTGETCFTVGSVTPESISVGCHTWKIAYLDKFYNEVLKPVLK